MKTAGAIADSSLGGEQPVTLLKPTDVLLGRGSGPNDHEGNILFRSLVRKRKSEYMATNHRQTKTKIAREIVDAVLAQNGRFLRKIDPAEANKLGISYEVDVWCPVDRQTCMEKAKQALRQKAENGRDDSPDSTPSKAASGSTFEDTTSALMPPEAQDRYAHETSDIQVRYPPISLSCDMRHQESHWDTSHPNLRPISSQSQWQRSHTSPGTFLFTEEAPPPQQRMSPYRMVELNPEYCSEKVHHNAFYGEDEEVDDGPEDDALENTLSIKVALRLFHPVGADDMESFHYSSNSNDAMRTAESRMVMDASNASVTSFASVFKEALFDTPSCAPRPGDARQDPSLFSNHRESSDYCTHSYDSNNNGRCHESRFSSGRDASCPILQTQHFGASDLSSTSLPHPDAFWGECSMFEEDATNPLFSVNSRPVELIQKSPMGDLSQNNIIQTVFDYKSGVSRSMPSGTELLDKHYDSSRNMKTC